MSGGPSVEEQLRSNYNPTGVAVMETMYSRDYLSIGGTESTDELAQLVGVRSTSHILDVGCGVGGPALRLAQHVGCSVVGLDLVEASIAEARSRAATRGLDHLARFEVGNATRLRFDDDSFDIVWGQDAWCHVPDKPAVIAEAARVLRPGGTIAFTDWLRGTGMSEAGRAAALDAAISNDAATAADYVSLLGGAGFTNIGHADISDRFVTQYRDIYRRLQHDRDHIVERFGERVHDIVSDINGTILDGFEQGGIAGGRFIATLPE